MASRAQKQTHKRQSAFNITERVPPAQERPHTGSDIPLLEWIVGAVGFLLVTSVIAFMLYHAVTEREALPDINLSVISVAPSRNGYVVTIKALNQGGSAAAGVVVEAELHKESKPLERSHVTIDYSPPGSQQQVGLFFTQDPRQFDLRVRALGYVEP
jgi:uncharacterized protein (TIGR02588 family)